METLLRKYLWAVDGVVIAIVACFCAHAAAMRIGSALLRHTPPPASASGSARSSVASRPAVYGKDIDNILDRNIFCSTCPPLRGAPATTSDGPALPAGPQKTALPLKLMAIMYASPLDDRSWSLAVIRDTDAQSAGPYRVGDKVLGAAIAEIQPTRVYLDNAGRKEFLDLLDASGSSPATPTVVESPRIAVATAPAGGSATPIPPAARPAPAARNGAPPWSRRIGIRGDRTRSRPP